MRQSWQRCAGSVMSMGAAGLLSAVAMAGASTAQTLPQPPVAAQRPHAVTTPFGASRNDEYYWLRDDTRKNPEILGYLKVENDYADAATAAIRPLESAIQKEIVSRAVPELGDVPYTKAGYSYYFRTAPGADYPVIARRRLEKGAPEQVLLDIPAMAKGHVYFSASGQEVGPDNRLLAFAEDAVGRRQFALVIKDLKSGKSLPDRIENIQPNLEWSADSRTVYYVEKDPVTLLTKRVKAHIVGTAASADRTMFEEPDSLNLYVEKTSDGKYLCVRSEGLLTADARCAAANDPVHFTPIVPRESGVFSRVDHMNGRWFMRTNKNADNFRIASAPDSAVSSGWQAWTDVVPGSDTAYITSFKLFRSGIALEERVGGYKRVRVLSNSGKSIIAPADEPAYTMELVANADPDTPWVPYTYDSLITPQRTYELNLLTGQRKLLSSVSVPGVDSSRYVTKQVWATARDGTKIPVTLAYKKGVRQDGTAPIYQYAYGSYGAPSEPRFTSLVPSLLDRGVVYAIAHVRGGGELGRRWYDSGRLYNKMTTFTDYIDVTRYLVSQGYGAKDRVIAIGGSAGGTLMGAIANLAPQDYRVIIAEVPYVDAVTTMLDPSIPLVTNEYTEWGNPTIKRDYDSMLTWSPYDNVRAQAYPAMFVGTGLWDSQVQYFEPTKWVARLRAHKTDSNPLVFRINMEGGHGGPSGRSQHAASQAEYLAFGLSQAGVTK